LRCPSSSLSVVAARLGLANNGGFEVVDDFLGDDVGYDLWENAPAIFISSQTAQEMENGPVVFSFTLNIGRARPHCMGKLTGHRGFPRQMHWFQSDRTKSQLRELK
jgi:hypothetical protein